MRITETVDAAYSVELNPTETSALRAALGEVCYGFHIPEFKLRMGSTENEAQQLFEKMDRVAKNRQNQVEFAAKEIRLLKRAHQETLRELGPKEYETRTGVDFSFGQALLEQFADVPERAGG